MSGSDRTHLMIGAAQLAAGSGGIARVARISAATAIRRGVPLTTLSLLDSKPVQLGNERALVSRSSQIGFGVRLAIEAFHFTHVLYDAVGTARAQRVLGPLRRPYAVWMHGIEVWRKLDQQRMHALEQADLRLVNSSYTLERFRLVNRTELDAKVCWLGTESDQAPPERPQFSGPPTALILGRIDAADSYKGHAELIASWPSVRAVVPDARLIIAGSGPGLDAVKSLVVTSPVGDAIEVRGFVAEDELDALWSQAHVLAMPSRKEGFGLVYIEAMRQGLPVLATQHDAGSEINIHEQTGLNVDLDVPGDLSDALVRLLGDLELAHRLGQNGRRRWAQHFRFSEFQGRVWRHLAEFLAL